jgi:hypothetical protein
MQISHMVRKTERPRRANVVERADQIIAVMVDRAE